MADSRAALLSQLSAATSELDAVSDSTQGRAVAQRREAQLRAAQLAATEAASSSSRQVCSSLAACLSTGLVVCGHAVVRERVLAYMDCFNLAALRRMRS